MSLRKQLNFLFFQGKHQELEEPRAKQIEPFWSSTLPKLRKLFFFGGQKKGQKKTWKIIEKFDDFFKYFLGDATKPELSTKLTKDSAVH